jgi:hypothetical protein
MMTSKNNQNFWAYALIALGVLFLATNFGWFNWLTSWVWTSLFIAGGGAFLYVYSQDRSRWWALIPGFALLAIGVAALSGNAAGGFFLALLGAGFAAVYFSNRQRWWSIIPAGVLFTLALVAWFDAARPGADMGWLFFLGIALTFATLFFLPEGAGRQRWAMYPALGSLAFMLIIMASHLGVWFVSLGLIVVGAYLIWRQGTGRGGSHGPSSPSAT